MPIRCLDGDKLFPPSKPIFCEERSVKPFFEIKCCSEDDCNKYIRFELPKRGEIHIFAHISTNQNQHRFYESKINKKKTIRIFHGQYHTSQINSMNNTEYKSLAKQFHRSHCCIYLSIVQYVHLNFAC